MDGADYGQQKKSKQNETIEIDLLSDDEGDKKPSAKPSSNDVVDLTWLEEIEQVWYAYNNITSITTIYETWHSQKIVEHHYLFEGVAPSISISASYPNEEPTIALEGTQHQID